ncbi:MAG TPA: DUF262 domain-containing protein, partial [Nitrospiraceae bacterium]|nr:DUF262 domain-containing protein [Nitrospiraceae bacterium]
MKQVPDLLSVRDMLMQVEEGELAIPEFQRPFVWRPPQVSDLLVSVARRWPIGTLLLLEGPQDFAVRPLAEAPELTSAKMLVLDGQQRVTALYRALGHHVGDEVYFVNLLALLEDGELSDEHIQVRRRTTFARQFPDLASRVRAGIALIGEIADNNRWHSWVTADGQDKQKASEFAAIRNDQLTGLSEYSIPAVRLERTIGFDALAKIFETINRTGVRLATFDLMVARLYPREFDLRREWEEAAEQEPLFEAYEVDGMELLRLIALRVFLSSENHKVKGIRQGDVLHLRADEVKHYWRWAVDAYSASIALVRERCGVLSPELLPAATMLLPIAISLTSADGSIARLDFGEQSDLAERFFWSAGLAQTYAQGANTQAVRDARQLSSARDGGPDPEVTLRVEVDIAALTDDRRRNESMLRTAMALLVNEGARDWLSGQLLREA